MWGAMLGLTVLQSGIMTSQLHDPDLIASRQDARRMGRLKYSGNCIYIGL